MKEIAVNSRVYGIKVVLVDDEDYDELSKYTWWLSKNKSGILYVRRRINGLKGGRITIHRQIMGLSPKNKMVVDHIDGNPLNNQKSNLRVVTQRQNCQNRKAQKGAVSQYNGVMWRKDRNKWKALINVNGKSKVLGLYIEERQAAFAFNWAAKSLRGDFARVNDLTGVF